MEETDADTKAVWNMRIERQIRGEGNAVVKDVKCPYIKCEGKSLFARRWPKGIFRACRF
jgi:hypothetical protein